LGINLNVAREHLVAFTSRIGVSNENKKKPEPVDDMALRLATARTSDEFGQAVLPVTANLTAGEQVVDPEETRNFDLDSGS
jgi:hypothetical protein